MIFPNYGQKGKTFTSVDKKRVAGLPQDELRVFFHKAIARDFEIERGRTLANAARNVVVGAVARAEPAVIITRVGDRHATEMSTDAQDDEPLGFLHAVVVCLRVSELYTVIRGGERDLIFGAVANEDGLAAPLDGGGLTQGDGAEVDLDGALCKHVCGGGHGVDELEDDDSGGRCRNELSGAKDEISEGALGGVARHVAMRVVVVVVAVADRQRPG